MECLCSVSTDPGMGGGIVRETLGECRAKETLRQPTSYANLQMECLCSVSTDPGMGGGIVRETLGECRAKETLRQPTSYANLQVNKRISVRRDGVFMQCINRSWHGRRHSERNAGRMQGQGNIETAYLIC
ncbi:hypothetical protein J6590_011208 [Homalodisca vitripennis]|nr:hypothetical protein J6590_011208 [Homalodisca vitripennis]